MAKIIANDVVLIRLYTYLPDAQQLGVNDIWYRCTGITGDGATDLAAVEQYSTGVAPFIKDLLTVAASYSGASLNIYRGMAKPTLTAVTNNGAGVGTVTGGYLPPQVRGIIHKQTNTGGAGGRGRLYIPFPGSSDNGVLGKPGGGYLDNLDLMGGFMDATFVAATGGDTSTMLHVLFNKTTRVTTDVVLSNSRPYWATQKSSGYYGKRNPPFTA